MTLAGEVRGSRSAPVLANDGVDFRIDLFMDALAVPVFMYSL
jgi:hypothetical protein